MGDLEQQLAELRARVARAAADCDRHFAYTPDEPQNVSHRLPGDEVETAFGRHLEKETLYAAHRSTAARISAH